MTLGGEGGERRVETLGEGACGTESLPPDGLSIHGESFPHENFDVKHATLGLVAMASPGGLITP